MSLWWTGNLSRLYPTSHPLSARIDSSPPTTLISGYAKWMLLFSHPLLLLILWVHFLLIILYFNLNNILIAGVFLQFHPYFYSTSKRSEYSSTTGQIWLHVLLTHSPTVSLHVKRGGVKETQAWQLHRILKGQLKTPLQCSLSLSKKAISVQKEVCQYLGTSTKTPHHHRKLLTHIVCLSWASGQWWLVSSLKSCHD